MHNHNMPMTVKSSSKPEVEFKYGGRLSSATRSSNNLAMDWDIWSKYKYFFAFLKARCHNTRKQKNICDGMATILKQELIIEMRNPNMTWRIILPVYLFTTELRHTFFALYFSK